MIDSSWYSILEKHQGISLPLHKVFVKAGIPTSTYYRTLNGDTELRYETACKVYRMLELLEGSYAKPSDKRVLYAKVSRL